MLNRCTGLLVNIDGVETSDLCGQLLGVISSSGTTDNSVLAIEVLGDFLQRGVAGLDVEEVDNEQFDLEASRSAITYFSLPKPLGMVGRSVALTTSHTT